MESNERNGSHRFLLLHCYYYHYGCCSFCCCCVFHVVHIFISIKYSSFNLRSFDSCVGRKRCTHFHTNVNTCMSTHLKWTNIEAGIFFLYRFRIYDFSTLNVVNIFLNLSRQNTELLPVSRRAQTNIRKCACVRPQPLLSWRVFMWFFSALLW